MGVTNRLVFDPTDANSIAASSSVGAYLLAGDDGSAIGSTSNALDVYLSNASIAVTATALDIRALTTSDEITAYQGTSPWVVSAVNLDIRDLTAASDSVASWLSDGSGNAISSTTGWLDVNIAGGTVDIDDSLANTAIENAATAVSTTAVNVVTSALASRKWLYLANEGNKSLYFGKSGVTAANGFPMHSGMQAEYRIGPAVAPQIIGGTGASSEDLRVMELS